jgi:hypothetical protein
MITKVAAAALLSVAVVAPASAAVIVQPGASVVQPPENVQLNIDVRPGDNILRGTTNQTNSIVLFQSSTDNLVSSPQGQARIESLDGSLGALTFGLENGSTFTSAEFNISPQPEGRSLCRHWLRVERFSTPSPTSLSVRTERIFSASSLISRRP